MALIKSISGIRGTLGGSVGENLTAQDIVAFASAYGSVCQKENQTTTVVIGRDGRLSGPIVSGLVSQTLQMMGIHVIDLGMTTTPTVEMAVPHFMAQGGIIVTASHNPSDWNALKLLNEFGEFISHDIGQQVVQIAASGNVIYADVSDIGTYRIENYLESHIDAILALPTVNSEGIKEKNFSILIDGINSSGATTVPALLNRMGLNKIDVIHGNTDIDFEHTPEPLPQNLTGIINKMKQGNYDLGIVVDPDVDRLAFIAEDGGYFGEEYTLVAVAQHVLSLTPGNTVSNLSSSRALADVTKELNGEYFPAAVGEVNVVAKMKEVNAVIGGEGNGGIIYPPLHYGRDALVGIALFLSGLVDRNCTVSQWKSSLPIYFMEKEKIQLSNPKEIAALLHKAQDVFKDYKMHTIDGVKIEFENGWVHLRKSNTEPIVRIYAEGSTKVIVKEYIESVKKKILS